MGVDFTARKAAKKVRKKEAAQAKRVRRKKNQPRRLCRGPCFAAPELRLADLEGLAASQREKLAANIATLSQKTHVSEQKHHEERTKTAVKEEKAAKTKRRRAQEGAKGNEDSKRVGTPASETMRGTKRPKLSTGVSLLQPRASKAGAAVEPPSQHHALLVGKLPAMFKQYMAKQGFAAPTRVQARCWPPLLQGRDMQIVAPPGSGKTLGYLIPAAASPSVSTSSDKQGPSVLVILPTRELAQQVASVAKTIDKHCGGFSCVCVTGGASKDMQLAKLASKPKVLVATPGRLLDCIDSGHVSLDSVRYLILDEADRMLSRGFAPDIDRLRELLLDTNTAMDVPNLSDAAKAPKTTTKKDGAGSKSRPQVALLTATMPGPVVKLANAWLRDPERIDISASIENIAASLHGKDDEDRALHQLDGHRGLSVATTDASIDTQADRPQTISSTITQVVHVCAEHKKPTKLLKHLSSIKQSAASAKLRHLPRVLVFVNRIKTCRFVEKHIAGAGYRVAVLHGDRSQSEREQALRDFKAGKANVLVATDIAARGLDITDLPYVVNYDFPGTMEVYVHRVGRTGRMASQGHAYSFMTREMAPLAGPMVQLLRQHEQSIDPNVVKLAEAYRVAAEKLGLANDADTLPGSEVGGAEVALRVAKPGTNDVLKELDMKPKRVKKAKRLDADEAHGRGDDHTPVNGRAALTATAREQRSISTSTPVTVVDATKTRENGPDFIAAKKFLGPRPGYVFKTAGLGVGYYPDRPLHIAANREQKQGAETAGKGNASSKRKNVIGAADFRPIGGVGRKKKVDEDATKTEKAQDNVPLLPGRLKQMRKMRRVEEWSSSSDEDSELRAKGRNARGGKRKVAERLSRGKSSLPGRLRKKLSV